MIDLVHNFYSNLLGCLLLIIFFFHLYQHSKAPESLQWFTLASVLLVLVLFLGFRSINSGVDTPAYYFFYSEVKMFSSNERGFEPGFYYITKLFGELNSFHLLLSFIVFVQVFSVFLSAKLIKINDAILPVMLFVSLLPGFDLMTNGLRQGVSLSVGMLIVVCGYHLAWVRPMILSAVFLHKSMLSYILSVFIPNAFYNRKFLKLIVLSGLIVTLVGFAGSSLGGGIKFADLLPLPLPGTGHSLGTKIDMYLYIEKQLLSQSMKLYFLLLSYGLIAPFIYFLFKGNDVSVIGRLAFLCLTLQFVFLLIWWTNFAYRFMYLSYIPSILLSVRVVEILQSKVLKLYLYFFVLLGLFTTYSSKNFASFNLTHFTG
ncbi:hypothetical protein C1E23_01285 [Pseudoalteromonas phenolica]|uniref:EpsG family protein n=1 Tax=Pseudoalteromonas phenolica TaxID=161398 RepID=A0A4Q7ITI2_9GAMM|nr:hypothetical protein C1E23_01285 [Pseudoalteromonas phenolica]